MKIKILSIELFLFFAFLFFFLGALYSGNLIPRVDLSSSIALHALAIVFLVLGSFFCWVIFGQRNLENGSFSIYFNLKFYILSYFCSFLGLFVTIAQVNVSINPLEFLGLLFSGNAPPNIRDPFLLEFSSGGLSGIIKMWANSSLAIVLMVTGFIFFFKINCRDVIKIKRLLIVSVFVLLVKVIFSMDRMSLFALGAAGILLFFKYRLYSKILTWIAAFFIFKVMDFLSMARLDNHGIIDFLFLYFYLGMANFELVLATSSGHSFGFNSIFSPLINVFKFFGIQFNYFHADYDWVWNPAQYGISYLFLDFSYFFLVGMFVLGFVSSLITIKAYGGDLFYSGIFFIMLYGFASFVVVPAIRGIDFYVALIVVYIISRRSNIVRFRINAV